MTIDEAIKICNTIPFAASLSNPQEVPLNMTKEELAEAMGMATKALKDVQQYHAIGTPGELKAAMKYVYLAKKHGTVGQVIENCVKYEEIGTPEECRAAMERSNEKTRIIDGVTECCGYDFGIDAFRIEMSKFCPACGRKVERNSEE